MKKFLILTGAAALCAVLLFLHAFSEVKKAETVTTGEKIAKYGKEQDALLVIDLQRDLTEKNGKMCINKEQSDEAIENINKIIEIGHLNVIYIRHEFNSVNPVIIYLTNKALRPGSGGSEIDPRILISGGNIFVKHMADAFSKKEFESFLVNNKINHLYISGADAEYCVDKTLKGALNRGYKVTVIEDAVVTKNEEMRRMKLKEFSGMGVETVSSEILLKKILHDEI